MHFGCFDEFCIRCVKWGLNFILLLVCAQLSQHHLLQGLLSLLSGLGPLVVIQYFKWFSFVQSQKLLGKNLVILRASSFCRIYFEFCFFIFWNFYWNTAAPESSADIVSVQLKCFTRLGHPCDSIQSKGQNLSLRYPSSLLVLLPGHLHPSPRRDRTTLPISTTGQSLFLRLSPYLKEIMPYIFVFEFICSNLYFKIHPCFYRYCSLNFFF